MQLRRSIAVIWRWSWLLILGAALAALAAYVLSAGRSETYRATATVLVNYSEALVGPTYDDALANQQMVKTYSQLVKSADVVTPVARLLDLDEARLRAAIAAQPRPDTQLLDVSASSTDAETAAAIANETAKALVRRIQEGQLAPQFLIENDLETQAAALQRLFDAQTQSAARLSRPQAGLGEEQRLVQLAEAQAQADATRQQLADVNRRLSDLRIAVAKVGSDVQVVDPAPIPTAPAGLSVTLITLLGAILGVLAAGAVAAVAEHLKEEPPGADAIVRATGAPPIGTIPLVGGVRRGMGDRLGRLVRRHRPRRLLLSEKKASRSLWEAYRMLRMNLEFARSGRWGSAQSSTPYALLITSVTDGEGRSTTAANLAIVLSRAGRRVVLIDADLSRPSLHEFLGLPNEAGLSSFLAGAIPGGDLPLAPVPGEHPGRLALLPGGPIPADPGELLASPKIAHVLERLRGETDVVVIDGPSLAGAEGGFVLARHVDGVVLVVDATRARVGALAEAAGLIRRTHTPFVGTVLNKVDVHRVGAQHAEPAVEDPTMDGLAISAWPSRPALRTLQQDGPQPEDAAVDQSEARPRPRRSTARR